MPATQKKSTSTKGKVSLPLNTSTRDQRKNSLIPAPFSSTVDIKKESPTTVPQAEAETLDSPPILLETQDEDDAQNNSAP